MEHTTHATSTAGTAAATAKEPWSEEAAKASLNPYELRLANFFTRRINAHARVTMPVDGREADVVEYFPGGETGLGKLKVLAGAQSEPLIVDCDETLFETLLAKIIVV